MNKIKRVSVFFRSFFQILLIGIPMLLIYAWATNPQSIVLFSGLINMNFIPHDYQNDILHELTFNDRVFGFAVSALPMLVELFILISLIKLFKLYEQGEIFSLNNVRYIRNIGYALMASQIVDLIYQALMGLALTLNNPHGHRYMKISIDQNNFAILFAGCIVILISWIMAEGCKLREEQQLTV